MGTKKVLITAGPTYEPIDPVRFIGNRSSGKMGYAIARAFLESGYSVVLVSGPVNISLEHQNLDLIKVESAKDMYEAVMQHRDYQIAVMSAAVADFTPKNVAFEKIKKEKGNDEMVIELVKTQDILASLGAVKQASQFLVGFALETHNEEANARGKLQRKGADMIVLNSLNDQGAGFGHDTNKVRLFFKDGSSHALPLMSKPELADELARVILEFIESI